MLCIQFMAVTLWSIELYSDTQEYKKVTKKNARKCSIEIRRVEFYFFRLKRTSSRQMLAKTSFLYMYYSRHQQKAGRRRQFKIHQTEDMTQKNVCIKMINSFLYSLMYNEHIYD